MTRTLIDRGHVLVSGASAAVFRIGFGTAGLLLVVRFFAHEWIAKLYVEPRFHFTYPGFDWVRPLPGAGMYLLFGVIGVAALAVAVGFWHRYFAVVFAMGLAYVELIDRTLYLNHYYWLVLTGLVIVFLPVSNSYSIDAHWGKVSRPGRVPRWVVWLLRFQVGMVYLFAGIAKLNSDWLLRAEPLATWLPARSELWLIGPVLTLPAVAYVLSWAGALFDLTIVGWLSWQRTRSFAYAMVLFFHAFTWLLFPSIGLFPLVMSLGALIFFPPDWPERRTSSIPSPSHHQPTARGTSLWAGLAVLYVLIMVAMPLRHLVAPIDDRWAGQVELASWQVMLTERSGSVEFIVSDPDTGKTWRVGPPDYLTDRQAVVMAADPALIAQMARQVSADYEGLPVAADAKLSVNGRPSRQLTDPDVVISGDTPDVGDWVLAAP